MLTIVIAVKDAQFNVLNRCLASIAALENAKVIDVIIVNTGRLPVLDKRYCEVIGGLRIVDAPPTGPYGAYNRALDESLRRFVLFLGCDDLVLPQLDEVLRLLSKSDSNPDIVACNVLMERHGIKGGSMFRSAILFRNWCQQGILYSARVFGDRRFDLKYPIQADHALNIELVARKECSVVCFDYIISFFSSGGLSSRVHDVAFRRDLPGIASRSFGWYFGLLVLLKRVFADLIKGKERLHQSPR